MTRNQIEYVKHKEQARANVAGEMETHRHNVAGERETHRSNVRRENEQQRANTLTHTLGLANLAQTRRRDTAANALGYAQLAQTAVRDQNAYQIGLLNASEQQRHNRTDENIRSYTAATDRDIRDRQLRQTGAIEKAKLDALQSRLTQELTTKENIAEADRISREIIAAAERVIKQQDADTRKEAQLTEYARIAAQFELSEDQFEWSQWVDIINAVLNAARQTK